MPGAGAIHSINGGQWLAPEPVRAVDDHVPRSVRDDRLVVAAVGGGDVAAPAARRQPGFTHRPLQLLAVDDPALLAESGRHAPPTAGLERGRLVLPDPDTDPIAGPKSERPTLIDLGRSSAARGAAMSNTVFTVLRQARRQGLFAPGDRLREEEIAEHLAVSRTPARDALRRFFERRLLEVSGGRGLMVRRLDRRELFERYQMRAMVEGTAARLTTGNAPSTEIELLADLQDAFEEADKPADWARSHKQFHDTIAGAVRNRDFHGPLEALQDGLALPGLAPFLVGPRDEAAAQEHRQILEAIAAHDPDAAEKAARDHIHSAPATRLKMLNAG